MKKISIILICFMLFAFVACSSDKESKTYYEEQNIPLPEEVTLIYDMEESEKGNLRIFAETLTGDKGIFELNNNTNSWTRESKAWENLTNSVLFEAKFIEDKTHTSVLFDALLAASEEAAAELQVKYFALEKDGDCTEIILDLSRGDEIVGGDNLFSLMAETKESLIGVDNANIIYSFSKTGTLNYAYEEMKNLNVGIAQTIIVEDVLYIIEDNGEICCLEVNTGEKVDGNKKILEYIEYEESGSKVFSDVDSVKLYKLTEKKLSEYDLSTNKSKDVFLLEYYNIRNGSNINILPMENENIYCSYMLSNGEMKIDCLTYIEKGVEVKSEPLNIYSLTENYVLEELVDAFQVENPDIPVKIIYGYTVEDGNTEEDAVKQLNTELLAGDGPDIVFMDGLSLRRYYEEGLLRDLNEIVSIKPLEAELNKNMLVPYQEEQEQYAIPLGFRIYGIVGEQQVVESFESTEEFINVLENENKNFVISDSVFAEAANILYIKNISQCFDEEVLDTDNLTMFYINIKKLYDMAGNSFGEDYKNAAIFESPETSPMELAVEWIYYNDLSFAMAPYFTGDSFSAVKYLVQEKDYVAKYLYEGENLVYTDKMQLTVTSQSNKDEELEMFIRYALGDGQTVISNGIELLPMNKKCLKENLVKEGKEEAYVISEFGYEEDNDPEMIEVSGILMSEEEYNSLESTLNSGLLSSYPDPRIKEIIMEGACDYSIGEKTLEEAVNEANNKISLYFQER